MTLPVQIGDAKTWIEAFVVPGSTPHLISRRWLSQHRCVVNFDPNNLCLESPEFGSVPLVLHSSHHLLLSLVSPSNLVDQYTVMIDYQNSPSSVVNNFQKCNEQIMDSLQSRNQVVDTRAEPGEKRAGNSTLVRRRSDHPVEFAVHLDDPNEEITEQWQGGLHEWYIRRDDQCSVTPNRIPRDVSEMRGYPGFCSCLKRRSVSVSTNSKVSTPRERDSHSAPRGPVAVLPQKPSVVAWFQRCFCVPHLFGLPSSRKVDSSNMTHIPAISGIAANGSGMVDKIAKTSRMMCWYLLMVGITFCLDRAVHVPHGTDTFHVDSWNSRGDLEQRVQGRVRRNRVDLVQVGGLVTNSEDRDTAVRLSWIQNTSCPKTQACNSVRSSEVASKAGRVLETDYSQVGRAEQEITISSGVCCRLGSGPASSWWKSVSDVSMEMERADDLATSICDQ